MSTEWFPEASKQTVITRSASLNAAVSFLTLISDTPAAVTIDKVLAVAAHFECWAWRDLVASGTTTALVHGPAPATHAQDTAAAPAEASASPAPSPPSPLPARQEGAPSSVGATPPASKASDKQVAAIFTIGKAKGNNPTQMKTWVKGQFNKRSMS
jgi:hypothetical protein